MTGAETLKVEKKFKNSEKNSKLLKELLSSPPSKTHTKLFSKNDAIWGPLNWCKICRHLLSREKRNPNKNEILQAKLRFANTWEKTTNKPRISKNSSTSKIRTCDLVIKSQTLSTQQRKLNRLQTQVCRKCKQTELVKLQKKKKKMNPGSWR